MTKEQFTGMVVDTDLDITIMVTHSDGTQTTEIIDGVDLWQGIIFYADGDQACRYENAELEEDKLIHYLKSKEFPYDRLDQKKAEILAITRKKFIEELQFPTFDNYRFNGFVSPLDNYNWFVDETKRLNS